MKSWRCQIALMGRKAITGVTASICTSRMATATAAAGAAECKTTQSGQWSASVSTEWTCATWTTARSASSARHTSATAAKALGLTRWSLRIHG